MSKAQYDLHVFQYAHSICVKNAYIVSLVKGTTTTTQSCMLITENMPSTNFIFYDEFNGEVMTQEKLASRYLWLTSVISNWQTTLKSVSFNAFIAEDSLDSAPQLNYKTHRFWWCLL